MNRVNLVCGRVLSMLALVGILAVAPLGCGDSKPTAIPAAAVESPAVKQANDNMMNSVKDAKKKK